MPSLTELYKSIYEKLNSIASEYADAQSRLTSSIQEDTVAKNKRIKKLEELLEKIKEVSEKVEYFTSIAEQQITSRNLLTITPREVDFRRLRDWTTLIDATNHITTDFIECLVVENTKEFPQQVVAEHRV